jgi:hypothetical protein
MESRSDGVEDSADETRIQEFGLFGECNVPRVEPEMQYTVGRDCIGIHYISIGAYSSFSFLKKDLKGKYPNCVTS